MSLQLQSMVICCVLFYSYRQFTYDNKGPKQINALLNIDIVFDSLSNILTSTNISYQCVE